MKEPVFGVKAGSGRAEMLIALYAKLEIFKAKACERKIDLEGYYEEIERLDGPEIAQRTIDMLREEVPAMVMSKEEAQEARMRAQEQSAKKAKKEASEEAQEEE